jgi:hypothetical protein
MIHLIATMFAQTSKLFDYNAVRTNARSIQSIMTRRPIDTNNQSNQLQSLIMMKIAQVNAKFNHREINSDKDHVNDQSVCLHRHSQMNKFAHHDTCLMSKFGHEDVCE